MLAMMLPTILLYEVSIWLLDRIEKEQKDTDETVGDA
jgi:Sec-independent protein secretion pathway component TatC